MKKLIGKDLIRRDIVVIDIDTKKRGRITIVVNKKDL